jgi:hypothetical protein
MTDSKSQYFVFTISDLSVMFNRSPASLRQWQEKGYIYFTNPGIRKVSTSEVKGIVKKVRTIKGIDQKRLDILDASMTLLEIL